MDEEARRRYAEKEIINTVNRILTNSLFWVLVVDGARTTRSGLIDILQRQNFKFSETY